MTSSQSLLRELREEGITHPEVLAAIEKVPREAFLPKALKKYAYDNRALPILHEQTISQPFIVALMTQALLGEPKPHRVLEIGTGSGYQAAILACIFDEVWTIERIESLQEQAKKVLKKLHFTNIHFKVGDGSKGWAEYAPYDGVLVTAAAATLPPHLLAQLSPEGGKLVIPVGAQHQVQKLTLIKRQGEHYSESVIERVSFVPLIAKNNHSSLK